MIYESAHDGAAVRSGAQTVARRTGAASFRDAVLEGLSRAPKALPYRFLYDARGSELFERICDTPEYYLTRTETRILEGHAREIASLIGPSAVLIELGSGASRKVRILLNALERPRAYVALDVSGEHMRVATQALSSAYPGLEVRAICADYSTAVFLPRFAHAERRIGFFPGSSIGNLSPDEARDLLALWARQLGPGSGMLVGVDLKKDPHILDAAYNDVQGITARFITNILERANRELGADFRPNRFAVDARYVPDRARVEIFLQSLAEQAVRIGGRVFKLARSERVHIENSTKYTVAEFQTLAASAGFQPEAVWTDPDQLFSVHFLKTTSP